MVLLRREDNKCIGVRPTLIFRRVLRSHMQDVPDDITDREVKANPNLTGDEKETTIRFEKNSDDVVVYTEIKPMMKWLLSIEESTHKGCRLHDGDVVTLRSRVPKGMVILKASSRKSQQNARMVSYGPNR